MKWTLHLTSKSRPVLNDDFRKQNVTAGNFFTNRHAEESPNINVSINKCIMKIRLNVSINK